MVMTGGWFLALLYPHYFSWLVVLTILKNMSSSMGRMTSHTLWKIKAMFQTTNQWLLTINHHKPTLTIITPYYDHHFPMIFGGYLIQVINRPLLQGAHRCGANGSNGSNGPARQRHLTLGDGKKAWVCHMKIHINTNDYIYRRFFLDIVVVA